MVFTEFLVLGIALAFNLAYDCYRCKNVIIPKP